MSSFLYKLKYILKPIHAVFCLFGLLLFGGGPVFGATLDGGALHTCTIIDGGVKCWGLNSNGKLGDNTTIDRFTPVSVSGLSGVTAIALGNSHSCALTSGGGVMCWGFNSNGQLGDNSTTHRLTPVSVSGLSGATAIALGESHSCALTSGGGVMCWGKNSQGQLGDNTTIDKLTPVSVSGLSGVTAIASGSSHSCALTSVGGVTCWGENLYGQLGDSTTTSSSTPVSVSGLSGVTAIALGNSHSCALSGDGVRCWGKNDFGQLGDNTTTDRLTPVSVSGLSGVTTIALGGAHSCALTSGGGVQCWGSNSFGQLGDNTTTDRFTPVSASGLSGVTAIGLGIFHSCALTSGDGVKCWGNNSNGQLGDNTTIDKLTPVDVWPTFPTNVSSSTSDGTYGIEQTIDIRIQFNEVVTVTGTPQLTLKTDFIDVVVDYSSGSGTDTLTFQYTVASGQISADLDYASTTALILNGGTIKNGIFGDAILTLPAPGAAGSLGANNALVIDTTTTIPLPLTASPLAAPTNLTAIVVSKTQINLSWTDNSSEEIGFKIERNDIFILTMAADITNYGDANLTCETTYNYSVKATNESGDSSAITASATTAACLSTQDIPIRIPQGVYVFSEDRDMAGETQKEESFIMEGVTVSNVVFEADVENHGVISEATIAVDVTLSGGELTGTITNQGTINDIIFIGTKLSGGTLGGIIINNRIGGVIQDVQLASGAILKGGKFGGYIRGDRDDPALITAARILQNSRLAYVRISPTAMPLPNNVALGAGVILPSGSIATDATEFGIEPEDFARLDEKKLGTLESPVFRVFSASDVAQIPSAAFVALRAEQIAELEKKALAGMTKEQFKYMPIETLSGLTADNMGGVPAEVLTEFTPEHLDALDVQEFKAMPNEDVSKLFVNFDAKKITAQQAEKLVPNEWALDLETGALTAPIDARLTLQSLSPPSIPKEVKLPILSNLKAGFGIGGRGPALIDSTQTALEQDYFQKFALSQNNKGTFVAAGAGSRRDVQYTFIPDTNNTIQVDTAQVRSGVSISAGGFYTVTSSDGIQYKVNPAPKNPVALSEMLDDGEVTIGESGDVLVEMPTNTRHDYAPRQVLMFEPSVEPAPKKYCVTRETETLCNFTDAPKHLQPGLHLPTDEKRTRVGETARMVYPDGTAQTVLPTVLSPDSFIEEAFKIEGVQRILFNADGTFYVFYQGNSLLVRPTFEVESEQVEDHEAIASSITSNSQGGVTYSIPIDDESTHTRRRGARQVLIFELFIEEADEDLCIKLETGEIVCEFDNAAEHVL